MAAPREVLDQIRQAVEKTPILLFMKGTASFPQCGFSARVVQVLESYGVPFKTVDVLENPLVREGVKEFASWPTIPQLYVGGQFVGGCDIVCEMHEQGELEPLLREAAGAAAARP
jgi:monothiol glutaredoxin